MEYFLQNTLPKMFDASEKCSQEPVKYLCWRFFLGGGGGGGVVAKIVNGQKQQLSKTKARNC